MREKLSVLVLGIGILLSSCGNQKKVEKPQDSSIPVAGVPVPAPKMMIVAKISVKPEKADLFIEAAKDIIEKSNAEEGCTFYQLYRDPYDPSKFIFVEEYKDQAAVDFHFAADYFNAFGPKIADYVSGAAEIKVISVGEEVIK
jgi:quinol monooxygenase YgiN